MLKSIFPVAMRVDLNAIRQQKLVKGNAVNSGEIFPSQYLPSRRAGLGVGAVLLCLSLLSGCATTAPAGDRTTQLESMLKDADAEVAAGRHEKAISMLNQAAMDHPTSATPWLKVANIWFEKENYPASIVAANEALQRDAANQDAKSLLVVAGLRVSAGAVAGLRPNSSVNNGTRLEAENLTHSLRSALGEKVLVPSSDAKNTGGTQKPKVKPRAAAPAAAAQTLQQDASNSSAADPFKLLK